MRLFVPAIERSLMVLGALALIGAILLPLGGDMSNTARRGRGKKRLVRIG